MRIENSTALVTGVNGILGRHLAAELIARGASRVYAAAGAGGSSLNEVAAFAPARILPLTLDVTDDGQALTASQAATDVTLLISNVGLVTSGAGTGIDRELAERDLAVNLLGTVRVARAFAPVLEANGGTLVTMLTMIALAPAGPGAHRARRAARAVTRALRDLLTPRGVSVVGVYPGAVSAGTPAGAGTLAGAGIPPADPAGMARRALDGVEAGSPEITPGDFSARSYANWREDPGERARQSAGWPRAGPAPPGPARPGTARQAGRPAAREGDLDPLAPRPRAGRLAAGFVRRPG